MIYEELNKILQDAILQYNRRNYSDSITLFNEVLKEDPTNPEANYYLGLMYTKDEKYQKAVIHLKAVVDMQINFIFTQQCRMLLGYIYYKSKEFQRALQEFLVVLSSNQNPVQAHAALAATYYSLEEKEKSLSHAEKAYQLDQYNLNAKNTYGYLLCDFDVDVVKGVEILREVVRLKPENPAYLDSLGWGYYKKGDLKAAITSINRALDIAKNSPEIKDHYNTIIRRRS